VGVGVVVQGVGQGGGHRGAGDGGVGVPRTDQAGVGVPGGGLGVGRVVDGESEDDGKNKDEETKNRDYIMSYVTVHNDFCASVLS
jgi:hypothetical protein